MSQWEIIIEELAQTDLGKLIYGMKRKSRIR